MLSAEQGHQIIYKEPRGRDVVAIVKVGAHYHTVTSLNGFYGRSYFCLDCEKSYKNRRDHNCKGRKCEMCKH